MNKPKKDLVYICGMIVDAQNKVIGYRFYFGDKHITKDFSVQTSLILISTIINNVQSNYILVNYVDFSGCVEKDLTLDSASMYFKAIGENKINFGSIIPNIYRTKQLIPSGNLYVYITEFVTDIKSLTTHFRTILLDGTVKLLSKTELKDYLSKNNCAIANLINSTKDISSLDYSDFILGSSIKSESAISVNLSAHSNNFEDYAKTLLKDFLIVVDYRKPISKDEANFLYYCVSESIDVWGKTEKQPFERCTTNNTNKAILSDSQISRCFSYKPDVVKPIFLDSNSVLTSIYYLNDSPLFFESINIKRRFEKTIKSIETLTSREELLASLITKQNSYALYDLTELTKKA